MATRIYTQISGAVGVTPSTWAFAAQINPLTLPGTTQRNTGATMTSKTETISVTDPHADALGRTIIGPLDAQTISGTFKGQMRGSESIAGANATLAIAVKLVQPSGADRGVLLAQTASDSLTVGPELTTTLVNKQFLTVGEAASHTLTAQTAQRGDYLVIEWGVRTSNTTAARTVTLSYGNNNATDLGENTTDATALNPWWELSQDLSFFTAPDPTLLNYAHPFIATDTINITEAQHGAATAALAVQVLDTSISPAEVMDPGLVTVHPTTHAIAVTLAQPATGLILVNGATPNNALTRTYTETFANTDTVTILTAAHSFTTGRLFVTVYDAQSPRQRLRAGQVTIDQSSYTVIVTFLQNQSGLIVVTAGAASGTTLNYSQAFTNQGTVNVAGSSHLRGTPGLLIEVYDASTPARRVQPGRVTVSQTAPYDAVLTFLQNASGLVVVSGAPQSTFRALSANVAGTSDTTSSTSPQLRSLTTQTTGSSSTPASSAVISRTLTGSILSSSQTPPSNATQERTLTGQASAASVTPSAAAILTTLRALSAATSGQSATPATTQTQGRALLAQSPGGSATPVVGFQVARGLLSVTQSQSVTPGATVTTGRSLTGSASGISATPPTASATLRSLTSRIDGASATPPASGSTGATLVATPRGSSTTSLPETTMHRALTAAVSGTSTTPALLATLARLLVAQLAGQSLLPSAAASTGAADVLNYAFPFLNASTVSIQGTDHNAGHDALVVQVLDASTPAVLIEPGSVRIDPASKLVEVGFLQGQSGLVLIQGASPGNQATLGNYRQTFTGLDTLSIDSTSHQFTTGHLLVAVYDTSTPPRRMRPGRVTIAQTAPYTVTLTFTQPQSGSVVLCAAAVSGGSPNYSQVLTNASLVNVPESTHGRGTARLFVEVYDASTPTRQRVLPGRVTVDPISHAVEVTFLQPQNGLLVISGSGGTTVVALQARTTGASSTTTAAGLTTLRRLSASIQGQSTSPLALMADPSVANYAVAFTGLAEVIVPQSAHQAGTAALLVQVLDTTVSPALVIQPGAVTVHPSSLEVRVQFLDPQTGIVLVNGASPSVNALKSYVETFTNVASVSIPQSAHGFATGALFVAVYDTSAAPPRLVQPAGQVTILQTAPYTVTVSFLDLASGVVVVCGAAASSATPNYQAAMSGPSWTVNSATHGRNTANLLIGLYDTQTPRQRLQAGVITVDPTTYLVTASFLDSQDGTIVISGSSRVTVLPLSAGVSGDSATPVVAASMVRSLTTSILGGSLTPLSTQTITRQLSTAMLSPSVTPPSTVTTVRSLTASVQGSSQTALPTPTTQRQLIAQSRLYTLTPSVILPVQGRSFTASTSGLSATGLTSSAVIRPVTAAIASQSQTPASTSTMASLRLLTAQTGGQSQTPSSSTIQQRNLLATTRGGSTTPSSSTTTLRQLLTQVQSPSSTSLSVVTHVRPLLALTVGLSVTTAADRILTALIAQSAQARASSATTSALVTTVRLLSASTAGSSATSTTQGALIRGLTAATSGTSATPLAGASMGTLRSLSTGITGSSQATATSAVRTVRVVLAVAAGTSQTPAASGSVLRPLVARGEGSSATPSALAVRLRNLLAQSTASSQTTSPTARTLRVLSASSQGASSTPAAQPIVTALVALIARTSSASLTPASSVTVLRNLQGVLRGSSILGTITPTQARRMVARLDGQSQTPALTAQSLRALQARPTGLSDVSTLALTGQRLLVCTIAGSSQTPPSTAQQGRGLLSQVGSQSQTPPLTMTMLRTLVSRIASQSGIPDPILSRLNILTAAIGGVSTTPAVNRLLTRGLVAQLRGLSANTLPVVTTVRPLALSIQGQSQLLDALGIPFSGVFLLRAHIQGISVSAVSSHALIPRLRVWTITDAERGRVWTITDEDRGRVLTVVE